MSSQAPQITDIAAVRPMSERERWRYEFAKAAMQGLLAKGEQKKGELLPGLLAGDAVDYADALLNELQKTAPPAAK